MTDSKAMLSDWDNGIIYGLPVEKCCYFLSHYHDFLDDSYIQYYLLYLASQGLYTKNVLNLSSQELINEVDEIYRTKYANKSTDGRGAV